jgi:benzoyl-CoA reductase/2-hydroxyglutaryl-CoA dehydratase subunit BcrC/BadD/HgdB
MSNCCCGTQAGRPAELQWFDNMIGNCLAYANAQRARGRAVVGIMCEFTPRELILAAGAIPVCLCGGSQQTIPAAEAVIPHGLCPLIKSTFGYHAQKSNPFLEMSALVVAETTCDGKKKMFELLAETRRLHVLELPQKQDGDSALALWKAEIGALLVELENSLGKIISDESLRAAARLMNRERSLRRELAALMKTDHPPLTGRQLLDLRSIISGFPCYLQALEQALNYFRAAPPICAQGKPRVLLTGVPMAHGAEKLVDCIENSGGLIVCQENCTGLKPLLEDVDESADDIIGAIAEKYFHLPCSVMTPNLRRRDSLRILCEEYRPDCIIDCAWSNCLTYDLESVSLRDFTVNKLGLPYLRLSTDYSPSDIGQLATRIEALFEQVGKA